MRKFYTLAWLCLLLISQSCHIGDKDPISYVDPKIGTGGHGHTYPGASLPFGMVQLSPDTRIDSWDGCSGYHVSDSSILGFSHTHLSGTGCGDYGDIRIMPTVGKLQFSPGSADHPETGYRSRFDHADEIASPAYYAVRLSDYDIYAELTSSLRTGMHRYSFPDSSDAHILIDLKESTLTEQIHEAEIIIINDREVAGMRRTGAWAKNHPVYFYAKFSKPFTSYGIIENGKLLEGAEDANGQDLKAYFDFNTDDGEAVLVKVGLSAVSIDGASKNLKAENPDWNFDLLRKNGENAWNKKLSKLSVITENDSLKKIFYTALYHAYLSPDIFSDADGRYLGHDANIHQAKDRNQYTVFSLWDTFRAEHPLMSFLEPEATQEMIQSMLDIYQHGGKLPVWELAGNETNCMIGYHAVPMIYDAYVKGIDGFDVELAYEAMKHSAQQKTEGIEYMESYGYVPGDLSGSSVSKTLEYAYDDWCIAQMAKALGKDVDYRHYIQRAQAYKNIFDTETGFMRGKRNGGFTKPFDPNEVTFMLTEANSWQYTFFAPHDISGLIELYGGPDGFEKKLDEMFGAETVLSGRHQPDISGLIGQYAHGNEPSHHMAYLYNYIGKPWKTQQLTRQICNEMYSTDADGYSGNEDCGQMSAWYVLSSMGLYSVTPGDSVLAIGSPMFEEVYLDQDNGNTFLVKARDWSPENIYIQKAYWNGEPYNYSYLPVSKLIQGGELTFDMGPEPNMEWASEMGQMPITKIDKYAIVAVPSIESPSRSFKNKQEISIKHYDPDVKIYYTVDGSEPNVRAQIYQKPFEIKESTQVKTIAVKHKQQSKVAHANYHELPQNWKIKINTPYGQQYTAGGDIALIDGIKGVNNFTTGDWQGYWNTDMVIEIDMGKPRKFKNISTGFLQSVGSWIWMPKEVVYEVSNDGKKWRKYAVVKSDVDAKEDSQIKDFVNKNKKARARYVRVKAKNFGDCPKWHAGAGKPTWLFADEIQIR